MIYKIGIISKRSLLMFWILRWHTLECLFALDVCRASTFVCFAWCLQGLNEWNTSSGDDSNAPRPDVSVPHLAGIGYVGWARQARSAHIFVFWAVYARAILGSWHIYMQSLNEKNIWENIYFQVGIISNFWLLISSPQHFFHGHTSKRLACCRTTAMPLLFDVRFHG